MLYLITGGSGSGKSEYAEKIAVLEHQSKYREGKLYYLAAMYPSDEECRERIQRHQYMRRDKGFETVECYTHLKKIETNRNDVVLLECMSNLLANEMYRKEGQIMARGEEGEQQMRAAILNEILRLERQSGSLIVVTNEVFSDGTVYEEETREYLRYLGGINTSLTQIADAVVEVVYSIPIYHKGKEYGV